jgi:hypothetical protein
MGVKWSARFLIQPKRTAEPDQVARRRSMAVEHWLITDELPVIRLRTGSDVDG